MEMLAIKPTSTMANKTILMNRIRQILRLYTQGTSKKKISELTSSSRNTVKKYIAKFCHQRLTYDVLMQMNDHDLELLFGYVEAVVKDDRLVQLQALLPQMERS
jgi:hypothetical protein